MSYLKLLNAHSKSGNQPSIKPVPMTDKQRALAAQGLCIRCINQKAGPHSYICEACQAEDTIENIRHDINTLRHKILNRPNEEGDEV